MPITRNDINETYENGHVVHSEQVIVDITTSAVEYDLHTKARAALAGNAAALANVAVGRTALATAVANADAVTNTTIGSIAAAAAACKALAVEVKRIANVSDAELVQIGRALRQTSQLIRLLIGTDLLTENTDT